MLERCYQGDNSDYLEKYYENPEKNGFGNEQTSKSLANNLGEKRPIIPVTVDKNSESNNHKNEDPKDALYFVDL